MFAKTIGTEWSFCERVVHRRRRGDERLQNEDSIGSGDLKMECHNEEDSHTVRRFVLYARNEKTHSSITD